MEVGMGRMSEVKDGVASSFGYLHNLSSPKGPKGALRPDFLLNLAQ